MRHSCRSGLASRCPKIGIWFKSLALLKHMLTQCEAECAAAPEPGTVFPLSRGRRRHLADIRKLSRSNWHLVAKHLPNRGQAALLTR